MLNDMSVSVVISTSGSEERRERFKLVLNSILAQTTKCAEIIVIWQGKSELSFFESYPTVTFKLLSIKNVCKCRNEGARTAKSDYIWFIDDDTTVYNSNILTYGLQVLKEKELDFIVANVICEGEIKALQSHDSDFILKRSNLRGAFSEPGLLFRKTCFIDVQFDELLGIGCIHGSSEGFDLGARLIKKGYLGQVTTNFKMSHPEIKADKDVNSLLTRTFFYSLGNGRVLFNNKFYFLYVFEVLKSIAHFAVGVLRINKVRMKRYFIRTMCLLAGPIVPKGER